MNLGVEGPESMKPIIAGGTAMQTHRDVQIAKNKSGFQRKFICSVHKLSRQIGHKQNKRGIEKVRNLGSVGGEHTRKTRLKVEESILVSEIKL